MENISIANQPVLDLDEEGGTTMQEHNIALEKSQIQIEHPPQNKIAQQVEKNNISEGTNKSTTDTLAKSKKRNRSSVKVSGHDNFYCLICSLFKVSIFLHRKILVGSSISKF